jgi:5'-deoxynucleotidase
VERNKFFAVITRMKYISRWGLMRNNITENIQEHSLDVAIIAHALAVINNVYFGGDWNADRIAVLAMYHDANEIITGDMPTPVKYYNPDIRSAYKEIEKISKCRLLDMLPCEMKEVYRHYFDVDDSNPEIYWTVVKAADKLSAYIKCVEERKSGNSEFMEAEKSLFELISKIGLPEVRFFIEKFLPAYEMTLDEINAGD